MISPALCSLLLSFLLFPSGNGKIITDPTRVSGKKYDFVIIGGGTGGNVVANRLTENPAVSVLVIEAGGTNQGVENSIIPSFGPRLLGDPEHIWNYTTIPQKSLNNREIAYPRGRFLGGSSSINFMVYTRGSSDEFDRFAKVTGDSGWSWKELQPYIMKSESFGPPADNHNTTGQFNPSVHGFKGPLHVALPGFPLGTDSMVIEATHELPEFPFNIDMNSGDTIGMGWVQATIGGGQRSSSATAYLASQYISRPNLDVLLNTQVTKMTHQGSKNGLPLFTGVEFAQTSKGQRYTVKANKEIVLSAGATNTPQLLMLSGIGDQAALAKLGIPTVRNLPSVGQNLSDHPLLPNQFFVNSTDTSDTVTRNMTLQNEQLSQWNESHTGPLANTINNQLGWFRLPSNDSIFEQFPDPSAGPKAGHFELLVSNGWTSFTDDLPAGNFLTLTTTVASPSSRGSVTLSSSDPFAFPLIDPAFLTSPFDIHVIVESIKAAHRFVTASVWKNYVIAPWGPGANLSTEADFEAYARNFTWTEWHPVGTASMSAKGASYGVVDPDLTVKGVKGIRIVDASVIPDVPAAHTQAVVYVIAERASDLIKSAWK